MLRKLTRGCGEKLQPKSVRTSQYPQVGLKIARIPSPENYTLTGSSLVSFRTSSPNNPSLLSVNANTYIKTDKGIGIHSVSASPLIFLDQYPLSVSQKLPLTLSSILSYQTLLKYKRGETYLGTFIQARPHINFYANGSPPNRIVYVAITPNGLFDGDMKNLMERFKGGVLSSLAIKEDGLRFKIIPDKTFAKDSRLISDFTSTRNITQEVSSSFISPEAIICSNFDCYYGDLQYFETNTNRQQNASWLLSQKTQYHFSKI